MWLSLFLFVWCCLCWTKTRNWSLERPKSKVKKPRDCKASLTPSSSGLSSTTTWKFYCYFPQARSKEIWDFSCNIYSKKDVCGYVFMKFWGHFTQNCWGQIYINVCCILWFHSESSFWHIYAYASFLSTRIFAMLLNVTLSFLFFLLMASPKAFFLSVPKLFLSTDGPGWTQIINRLSFFAKKHQISPKIVKLQLFC